MREGAKKGKSPREKFNNRLVLLRSCSGLHARVRGKTLKDSKQAKNVIRFAFEKDLSSCCGEKGLATTTIIQGVWV